MTALDLTYLLYSPSSITYVRELLAKLSGGVDYQTGQYLYRFRLPSTAPNSERIYTLGSRGREYLQQEAGLPVDWYFRPGKTRHFGYNQLLHNLLLTRFLVAARRWTSKQPDFRLACVRISYELAKAGAPVERTPAEKNAAGAVIPDAWLHFERLENGNVVDNFPIMLEIDRGTTYRVKFKERIVERIEFIQSGTYKTLFGTNAVVIAYATTGQTPEHTQTRCRSLCDWTNEALSDIRKKTGRQFSGFMALILGKFTAGNLLKHLSGTGRTRPHRSTFLPADCSF